MKVIFLFAFSGYFSVFIGFISNLIFVRLYGIDTYGNFLYYLLISQFFDSLFNELSRSKIKYDNQHSKGLYSNIIIISTTYYLFTYLLAIQNVKIIILSSLLSYNTFFSKFLDNEKFHSTTIVLSNIQIIFNLLLVVSLFALNISNFDIYINISIVALTILAIVKFFLLEKYLFIVKLNNFPNQILLSKHIIINIIAGTIRDKIFNLVFAKYFGVELYGFYNILSNFLNLIKKLPATIYYKFESKILTNKHYVNNRYLIDYSVYYILLYGFFCIILLNNLDLIFKLYKLQFDYHDIAFIAIMIGSTALISFSLVIVTLIYDHNDRKNEIIKAAAIRLIIFATLLTPYLFSQEIDYVLYANLFSSIAALLYYTVTTKNYRIAAYTLFILCMFILKYYFDRK